MLKYVVGFFAGVVFTMFVISVGSMLMITSFLLSLFSKYGLAILLICVATAFVIWIKTRAK